MGSEKVSAILALRIALPTIKVIAICKEFYKILKRISLSARSKHCWNILGHLSHDFLVMDHVRFRICCTGGNTVKGSL